MKKLLFLTMVLLLVAAQSFAGIDTSLTGGNTLAGNDDGSTGLVSVGFDLNYFGTTYTQLYVNNNGNVTFNGSLGTYTPYGITGASAPIIAPFFADVDTSTGALVTYGTTNYGSGTNNAFVVNWWDNGGTNGAERGVGYYYENLDKLNAFQLVLVDRSDVGAGDFDMYFNYDQIQWETGDASGGSGGLGGTSAHVGYSNGNGNYYEFTGSGVHGAFLDNGPDSLSAGTNDNLAGTYLFQVRNGNVNPNPNPTVPTPSAFLLGGIGLLAVRRFKRKFRG